MCRAFGDLQLLASLLNFLWPGLPWADFTITWLMGPALTFFPPGPSVKMLPTGRRPNPTACTCEGCCCTSLQHYRHVMQDRAHYGRPLSFSKIGCFSPDSRSSRSTFQINTFGPMSKAEQLTKTPPAPSAWIDGGTRPEVSLCPTLQVKPAALPTIVCLQCVQKGDLMSHF